MRWRMWSPTHHLDFPPGFRRTVEVMWMASRRPESLMYLLQDEIVLVRRAPPCSSPPPLLLPGRALRCARGLPPRT